MTDPLGISELARLFANQRALEREAPERYAAEAGFEPKRFARRAREDTITPRRSNAP